MKALLALACAMLLGGAGLAPAGAAPFPQDGPIELTVLFPAGSSADVTARLLADGLSRRLGQSVVVINRPGAGGALGYRYVAGQKPDGYALVWNSNSISTTYYSGALPIPYTAFAPVAQVLTETPVLAVRADAKWRTLGDLIADARARPEAITVANSGAGSHTHITAVALFDAAGARVVHVPFGAAQLVPSVLGGLVDAAVQLPAALASAVQSGQLRLLAAMAANRDPAFPDVPTAREQGVDVQLEAWRGIAAPKGTPPAAIAVLEDAIRKTVASPEFISGCERLGARPAFLDAADFGRVTAEEDGKLAHLMDVISLKKR